MKNNYIKIIMITLLIATFGFSTLAQSAEKKTTTKVKTGVVCPTQVPKKAVKKAVVAKKQTVKKALPRLLDLGASKCIPCKMMVPVLDELTKEYKGKLKVEFIDVWKDESAGRKYNIQSIPTQIFFDAKGKEFYRHTGYFPKEDILKVFKDNKIKLGK